MHQIDFSFGDRPKVDFYLGEVLDRDVIGFLFGISIVVYCMSQDCGRAFVTTPREKVHEH